MALYSNVEDVLHKKYGVVDIDKAYLNIDYNNKTELVDNYGRTISHSRPYSELLTLIEKTLTEEIP